MRKIPLGVKLISYSYYFYSVLSVIIGIIIISLGVKFFQRLPLFNSGDLIPDSLELLVFTLIWISALIFGIFSFFFADSIIKGKEYARDVLLIMSSLLFIINIFVTLFIINLAIIISLINAVVIIYLLYDQRSRIFFKR